MARPAKLRAPALRALARLAGLAALVMPGLGACARPAICDGLTCAAACPRDAARDASGRCACAAGSATVLGACVPPAVADAFCGAAAVPDGAGGCTFRRCRGGETLDLASGTCEAGALLAPRQESQPGEAVEPAPDAGLPGADLDERAPTPCASPALLLVESGVAVCAPPEAACPRGAIPEKSPAGARCAGSPRCPAGSLPERGACRPIVTSGGQWVGPWAGRRVDLGAWAALVLGIDGGRGSAVLCQPLASRPGLFAGPELSPVVHLAIDLRVPDQDITRVEARVRAWTSGNGLPVDDAGAESRRPLGPGAQAAVERAVTPLVEALRALGGEAAAASADVEVACGGGP